VISKIPRNVSRRFGLGLAVVGLLILAMGLFLARRDNRTSRGVGPPEQTFDFVRGWTGDELTHRFTLRNEFTSPLRIKDVLSSCGCTVAGALPEAVPPDATVQIPVTVNLDQGAGAFSSSVTVLFEDHDPVRFRITGDVVAQVPDRIEFPNVRRGERIQKEFFVKALPGRAITVKSIEYDSACFDVHFERSSEGDWRVEVSLTENIPYGFFEKRLNVKTDDAKAPEKIVMVNGHVYRRLEAEPWSLYLRSGDKVGKNTLRIFSAYDEPVVINRIEVEPQGYLSIDLSEISPGREEIEVPVDFKGKYGTELIRGTIKVHAQVGGLDQSVEVDWFALVRVGESSSKS